MRFFVIGASLAMFCDASQKEHDKFLSKRGSTAMKLPSVFPGDNRESPNKFSYEQLLYKEPTDRPKTGVANKKPVIRGSTFGVVPTHSAKLRTFDGLFDENDEVTDHLTSKPEPGLSRVQKGRDLFESMSQKHKSPSYDEYDSPMGFEGQGGGGGALFGLRGTAALRGGSPREYDDGLLGGVPEGDLGTTLPTIDLDGSMRTPHRQPSLFGHQQPTRPNTSGGEGQAVAGEWSPISSLKSNTNSSGVTTTTGGKISPTSGHHSSGSGLQSFGSGNISSGSGQLSSLSGKLSSVSGRLSSATSGDRSTPLGGSQLLRSNSQLFGSKSPGSQSAYSRRLFMDSPASAYESPRMYGNTELGASPMGDMGDGAYVWQSPISPFFEGSKHNGLDSMTEPEASSRPFTSSNMSSRPMTSSGKMSAGDKAIESIAAAATYMDLSVRLDTQGLVGDARTSLEHALIAARRAIKHDEKISPLGMQRSDVKLKMGDIADGIVRVLRLKRPHSESQYIYHDVYNRMLEGLRRARNENVNIRTLLSDFPFPLEVPRNSEYLGKFAGVADFRVMVFFQLLVEEKYEAVLREVPQVFDSRGGNLSNSLLWILQIAGEKLGENHVTQAEEEVFRLSSRFRIVDESTKAGIVAAVEAARALAEFPVPIAVSNIVQRAAKIAGIYDYRVVLFFRLLADGEYSLIVQQSPRVFVNEGSDLTVAASLILQAAANELGGAEKVRANMEVKRLTTKFSVVQDTTRERIAEEVRRLRSRI